MIRLVFGGLRAASLLAVVVGGVVLQAQQADTEAAKKGHHSVTVLDRTRLGSYIEETALIPHGRFGTQIAMVTGYEVYGMPVNGRSRREMKKLFDIRDLGIKVTPKGMAYLEPEDLFVFIEGNFPTQLFLTDEKGRPQPKRPITYLPGFPLNLFPHPEGLTYLPRTSAFFPDHLLMAVNLYHPTPPYVESRLEVMSRDGVVVHEIVLPRPLRDHYVCAATVTASDTLLVGLDTREIWTLDFSGNIVSGPVPTPGPCAEGLEALPDGRIVMSESATLHFFDEHLNRLEEEERDAGIGFGFIGLSGIAWNSHTRQHLLATNFEATGNYFEPQIVATISPSLRSASQLFEIPAQDRFRSFAIAYLPDEQLVAILRWSYYGYYAPEIALYNHTGQLVELIDLSPVGGDPLNISYIAETRQFAVVSRGATVKIVSRGGTLVRDIDFAPQGITALWSLTYFNPQHPSGGQFLVFGSTVSDRHHAFVTDFDGHVLSNFSSREELGLLYPIVTTITTGHQAGAFSATDAIGYEMVVFKLK